MTSVPRSQFIAYLATSADGWLQRDNRSMPDWTSEEDWAFFQAELATTDAVVAGRRTYELARERLQKRNTFVLTSRVKSTLRRGSVTFVNPKAVDLEELFAPYKKVALVGGAEVYTSMLKRGLLDELYLTIEPFLLGQGLPLFSERLEVSLTLLSVKKLNDKGTLLLRYRV